MSQASLGNFSGLCGLGLPDRPQLAAQHFPECGNRAKEDNRAKDDDNSDKENEKSEPVKVDPQQATWDRLKQLGVSFITPGDLAAGSRENSVWIPQVGLFGSTISSGIRIRIEHY